MPRNFSFKEKKKKKKAGEKKKKKAPTTQPSQPNALEMLPHANQAPIQLQAE